VTLRGLFDLSVSFLTLSSREVFVAGAEPCDHVGEWMTRSAQIQPHKQNSLVGMGLLVLGDTSLSLTFSLKWVALPSLLRGESPLANDLLVGMGLLVFGDTSLKGIEFCLLLFVVVCCCFVVVCLRIPWLWGFSSLVGEDILEQ